MKLQPTLEKDNYDDDDDYDNIEKLEKENKELKSQLEQTRTLLTEKSMRIAELQQQFSEQMLFMQNVIMELIKRPVEASKNNSLASYIEKKIPTIAGPKGKLP